MKKFYFIFLLFLSAYLNGQPYEPMLDSVSNTWYYTLNVIPVRQQQQLLPNCNYTAWGSAGTTTLTTTGDTIINGLTYLSVLEEQYGNPSADCIYGFLREDTVTRKVYFMDYLFNGEELIYDFSMGIGDNIQLSFLAGNGYFSSGTFTLDSIGTIMIPAGLRRIFYLNNHSAPSWMPLEWIESTGHPGHLVYTKSGNFPGGMFNFSCIDNVARDFYQQLTCFEHNSQKIYFDSCSHAMAVNNWCFYYADSCNYWNICSGIEEINSISSFQVLPNPANEFITVAVSANSELNMLFTIYSIDGKLLVEENLKVHQGSNQYYFDVQDLDNGFYLAELKSETENRTLKLIVVR
jgi:hypothetical protein